jgi:CrcB protein
MSSSFLAVLGVGLTGALGAGARFLTVEWIARRWGRPFPLAIWLINVVGSFLLGILTTALGAPSQLGLRTLLGVGFLGGYTTFSTLSYETFALARRGETQLAWLNAVGTVVTGLAAAFLGLWIGLHIR